MKFDITSSRMKSKGHDSLAQVVLERLARAAKFKNEVTVFQNLSFYDLCVRSRYQYRREFTPEAERKLKAAFPGKDIKRYYGLTQIKTNATRAWKRDLVINNFDAMFTTFPTPEPELDKASLIRIREQAERKLWQMAMDAGVADLSILMRGKNQPDPRFEDFLNENIPILKKEEAARIKSLAFESSKKAKTRLTDMLVQSNFRQVYGSFTHDQVLYGMGFMKFPDYRRIQTIKHEGKKVVPTYEVLPLFRNPSVFNMFPVGDGADLQTNTATIELAEITKVELINLIGVEGYEEEAINKVLRDFTPKDGETAEKDVKGRNWLGIENYGDVVEDYTDYWGPDGKIAMVIHEGFLTGQDLAKAGMTGYKDHEVVNATVVVVGGYTIRCTVSKSPKDFERSYFAVPFNRFGTGIWDVLGMGAMLYDTEERVNTILNIFENNMDWASRPPIMFNPNALANPGDAANVNPGGRYEINVDEFGDRVMDPIKPMAPVSAQYQLLYAQVTQLLRQADEECGVPAFAYSAQDFGKSSLGEYSQRMSNALRTIKDAALEEDNWLIEPAFEGMFNRIMQQDADLAVGQDVKMQVRGLTGLLQDDLDNSRKEKIMQTLLAVGGQRPDLVPPEAIQYSVREFLDDAGFPVDILGMEDPTIRLAIAESASNPATANIQGNIMQRQVPATDGRSGPIAQGAVANANGSTTY